MKGMRRVVIKQRSGSCTSSVQPEIQLPFTERAGNISRIVSRIGFEIMRTLSVNTGLHHLVKMHFDPTTRKKTPVLWLLTDNNVEPLSVLTDYFRDRPQRNLNWQREVAQVVGLFFDFARQFKFDTSPLSETVTRQHCGNLPKRSPLARSTIRVCARSISIGCV